MQKTIDYLSDQLHAITPLGANSSLVDTVRVVAYGQKTSLKHLATIGGQGTRVTISPHDPNLKVAIVKACQEAGFDAYVFSKESVIVTLPMMSGETKDETRKRIKKLGDETKIAIRNIRQQFKKGLLKDDKDQEKAIQQATDVATEIVDDIVKAKSSYVK